MPRPQTFNPPPTWPAPPPGWQPPPGWEPDPAWGPAPDGWRLFVPVDRHPWLRAFGTAAALYVVVLVAAQTRYDLTPYGQGRLLAPFLLGGLVAALFMRTRTTRWPTWAAVAAVVVATAVLGALSAAGAARRDGADDGSRPTARSAGPDRAQLVERLRLGSRQANAGVLAPAEADCLVDRLLERPGLPVEEVLRQLETMTPAAAQQAALEALPGCLDPQAAVEPRPLTPQLRAAYVAGLQQGAPELTDEEAGCVLDSALRRGVTARQLTLSEYDAALLERIGPVIQQAGQECLGG